MRPAEFSGSLPAHVPAHGPDRFPGDALPWPRSATPWGHPFARQMGELLFEMRARSGMTQSELAAALDTTQPAVSKLEVGRHLPSIGMLIRIAEATRTSLVLQAELTGRRVLRDHVSLWPVAEPARGRRRGFGT